MAGPGPRSSFHYRKPQQWTREVLHIDYLMHNTPHIGLQGFVRRKGRLLSWTRLALSLMRTKYRVVQSMTQYQVKRLKSFNQVRLALKAKNPTVYVYQTRRYAC